MSKLYNNINESFDSSTGSIGPTGYVTFSGTLPITVDPNLSKHRNIRSFTPPHSTAGATMADLKMSNIGSFQGVTVGFLTNNGTSSTYYQDNEYWALTTSGVGGTTLTATPQTIIQYTPITNLCANGDFEGTTTIATEWQLNGATSTVVSTDRAKFGVKSLKVITDGGSAGQGVFYATPTTNGIVASPSTTYTIATWIYSASGGFDLRIGFDKYHSGGSTGISYSVVSIHSGWNRISMNATTDSNTDHIFPIFYTNAAIATQTFYLDGVLVVEGSVLPLDIPTNGTSVTSSALPLGSITTFLYKDPEYNYQNSLYSTFSGSTLLTTLSGNFSSTFADDILTGFEGNDYKIAIDLLNYPLASSSGCFRLASSYVDFTSDSTGNYSPIITDSFPFSSSLTDMAGTGSPGAVNYADVTANSNVITDTMRTLNIQGAMIDPPDSSFSVCEESTNLVLNSGFETNLNNWYPNVAAGFSATRSTDKSKSGVASLKLTETTAGASNSISGQTINLDASGSTYTLSFWCDASGFTAPASSNLFVYMYTDVAAQAQLDLAAANSGWTYYRLPIVTENVATTLDYYITAPQGTIYIDDVQIEKKAFSTPYIPTDGATATRGVGTLKAPASLLNSTQGWVAARVRLEWDAPSGGVAPIFAWADNGNSWLKAWLGATDLTFSRYNSAGSDVLQPYTPGFGNEVTVIAAWDASNIKVSVNGAAFTTLADAHIPTLASSTFDIGCSTVLGDSPINSEIQWFACGTGTLTNTDAANINGFGNTDPTLGSFPATAATSAVMPFDTNKYSYYNKNAFNARITFNRSSLVKSNPADLHGVRFRLLTSGTGPVKFQPYKMTLYSDSNYTKKPLEVDTKQKKFTGVVMQSGTLSPATADSVFFYPARPKNTLQSVKFNTGSPLTMTSGTNELKLFYRYNVDPITSGTSSITTTLTSTSGVTSVSIDQTLSGTTYRLGSMSTTLSGNTDYVLRTNINDYTVKSSIYSTSGVFYKNRIATTETKPITVTTAPTRGYVGWKFSPYNYDFTLNEIAMERVEFGTFTSKQLPGIKPVIGAKLNAHTSLPITMISSSDFVANGDAALTTSSSRGNPPPDYIITRSGINSWSGGISTSTPLYLGDTNELYLSGSIYPWATSSMGTTYSGTYRVVLLGKENRAAYVYNMPNLIGNQWNNFVIPIRPSIIAGHYNVIIQNVGFYPSTFEVDSLELNHNTISWSATNNGSLYQPFYDNINNEYSALKFRAPGTVLQVKAAALSDIKNWVESYTLYPMYNE